MRTLVTTNLGSQNLKIECARKFMELAKTFVSETLTTGRDQTFNKLTTSKN